MRDWIKLENAQPEFETPVLVFGQSNDAEKGYVMIARLTERIETKTYKSFVFEEGETGTDMVWFTVSHWMSLPEKPKFI